MNKLQSGQFHDSVQRWFEASFAAPTAVQTASWPVIASGAHALITAPTGSGKTLTAFLTSLSKFASGEYAPGQTRVLYISPLKALNNDIQRNLMSPLAELQSEYGYPAITVRTRSGDTSQGDRQRMLKAPPDILITTPESLGLLLTTTKGRQALSHVETVILDEVHSVVDNRRGVALFTHLERLADFAGEFQRIALSATVNPLSAVADYIAGRDEHGRRREVTVVNPAGTKEIDFRVRFPEAAKHAADEGKKIWDSLSDDFKDIIHGNQSTLFFTNSRRMAEKITLKINSDEVGALAYAHHGSLAREVRSEVETRLKAGELKAIVATNTLEMGIDVGHLDEVVMVQSPPSVASALQRIGRAGHQVGETSVGTLYPTHAEDFLEAAVLARAIATRDLEPLKPMRGALDVLTQIIISICATDPWPVDQVFNLVTRAAPYADLTREQFDLVVEMLAGRYSGSRVRELKPRITYDRLSGTIQASKGAILALYNSGGTIPDRGYYQMRHLDTGGVLGELDEEFVWEAMVGDTFTLGTQHWQVHRITHNDVIVRAAKPGTSAPPFWRSEFFNRSYHFSNRIGQYLEMQEGNLREHRQAEITEQLIGESGFGEFAAAELTDYLDRQRKHTEAPLPHRHHVLLELVRSGPAGYRGPDDPRQLVIHTYWGGCLNQPFALALKSAWQERYGGKPDVHADNNAIVLQCKEDPDPHEIMSMITPENLLNLLRGALEQSGFFGARFRECSGRSLLLSKQKFNQRLPLWMSRLQAKKLLTQVKKMSDFPVMLETWRTCLDDEFDLPSLNQVLTEIADGTISWSFVTTTTPSPFAQDLTFNQVSRYMYADDTPDTEEISHLGDDLIAQVVRNDALRPRISEDVIAEFTAKRQRRYADYGPTEVEDWLEWVKERILIPAAELPAGFDDDIAHEHLHWLTQGKRRWLTHAEHLAVLHSSELLSTPNVTAIDLGDERGAVELAREILSFYGPLTEEEVTELLPSVPEGLLSVDETFIHGNLIEETDAIQWCDAENFEILLRMQRARRRRELAPLPKETLAAFWATQQRLHSEASEQNMLFALETLRGVSANVDTLLTDYVGARLNNTYIAQLDDFAQRNEFAWVGTGKEQITLTYPEERELFTEHKELDTTFSAYFADPQASYQFHQIADTNGLTSEALNEPWWRAVWSGHLACDGLTPLSQANERQYKLETLQNVSSRRRLRRSPRSWAGYWHLLEQTAVHDPLTQLEADKDRVRLLLDRYGFINRDIVQRENIAGWRWRHAFRALRIMELAGEVVNGLFFIDLASPQFATPGTLSKLTDNHPLKQSFWCAASDPISPCGLGLVWPELPTRRAGNFLSFHDTKLALSVTGYGKELQYHVPAESPDLPQVNAVLEHLVSTRKRVTVQSINGEPAKKSGFVEPLARQFNLGNDHKALILEPK